MSTTYMYIWPGRPLVVQLLFLRRRRSLPFAAGAPLFGVPQRHVRQGGPAGSRPAAAPFPGPPPTGGGHSPLHPRDVGLNRELALQAEGGEHGGGGGGRAIRVTCVENRASAQIDLTTGRLPPSGPAVDLETPPPPMANLAARVVHVSDFPEDRPLLPPHVVDASDGPHAADEAVGVAAVQRVPAGGIVKIAAS